MPSNAQKWKGLILKAQGALKWQRPRSLITRKSALICAQNADTNDATWIDLVECELNYGWVYQKSTLCHHRVPDFWHWWWSWSPNSLLSWLGQQCGRGDEAFSRLITPAFCAFKPRITAKHKDLRDASDNVLGGPEFDFAKPFISILTLMISWRLGGRRSIGYKELKTPLEIIVCKCTLTSQWKTC